MILIILLIVMMSILLITYAMFPMLGIYIHDYVSYLWHKYIIRK